MTEPTPLSPVAAAVLDAYETSYTESGLVSALRALSSHLGHKVLGVRCVDCSQIELIANELDGIND